VLFIANGAKTIHAQSMPKANPTGGMCPWIPLAMTIFTDYVAVNKANRTFSRIAH
jgi:hypothetical protein